MSKLDRKLKPAPSASCERIVEAMLALGRGSKSHRILAAGANSAGLTLELHRRGFFRVATTAHCGLPAGQYDLALLDWRQHSIKSLDSTLDWLVDFLAPAGALVLWFDPQPPAGNQRLRSALDRHGLTVECGTIHDDGTAVCVRRPERNPLSRAA